MIQSTAKPGAACQFRVTEASGVMMKFKRQRPLEKAKAHQSDSIAKLGLGGDDRIFPIPLAGGALENTFKLLVAEGAVSGIS